MHVQLNWIASPKGRIALLQLNRPEKVNAFSSELISEMQQHLTAIASTQDCRIVVLGAKGKHFSAGADLQGMKESASMTHAENIEDAERLSFMLESLAKLPQPTVAVTQGASYGGALGLLASCDIVLANENSKFCLSELKLGLLPAMIYPFLLRKMKRQYLRKLSMTARVFNAEEALQADLIDEVFTDKNLPPLLSQYLNDLFSCGPEATADLKNLDYSYTDSSAPTSEIIATARTRPEGQHGLKSFFNKSKPEWFTHYDHDKNQIVEEMLTLLKK